MSSYAYRYGNSNNGYLNGKAKTNGRQLTRFQSWGMGNNNRAPFDDEYNQSSPYADLDQTRRDHVCRPVIVSNDGRLVPAILDCPPKYKRDVTASDNYLNTEAYDEPKDFIPNVQNAASAYNGVVGGRLGRQRVEFQPYGKPVTGSGSWGLSSNAAETEFFAESARNSTAGTVPSGLWGATAYADEPYGAQSYSGFAPPKRSSVASIDSRAAAKKYGGKFVW